MALLYQHQKGSVVRGTLCGFSTIGQIISLIALFLVGKFSAYEFSLFIRMIPAALLGFLLSQFPIQVLDKGHTRGAILSVSVLSALTVIVKTFMKFMR